MEGCNFRVGITFIMLECMFVLITWINTFNGVAIASHNVINASQ